MSEKIKDPEIKKEELLNVINKLEFIYGEEFEFNGSMFNLIMLNQEDVDSDPDKEEVFYSASTENKGAWDIYILETLSREKRDRFLFHEILECNLEDQGFDQPLIHNLSRKIEEETFGNRE